MNQNADALFKLIIPGIFLLLWILGQLFNREMNEARNGRRPLGDPLGPRPDRPGRPGGVPDSGLDPSDPMSVIDPRTGRPVAVVFPGAANDPRQSRSRQGRPNPRRGEPNRGRGRPPAADPSARPPQPGSIAASLAQPPQLVEAPQSPTASRGQAAIDVGQIRDWLGSPERVREAILVSQILSRPRGLDRLRPGQRRA
jgi:hypothetical protein